VRSIDGWLPYLTTPGGNPHKKEDLLINSYGNQLVIIDFDQASTRKINNQDPKRNKDIYILKLIREFERFAFNRQQQFFTLFGDIISRQLKSTVKVYESLSLEDIITILGSALERSGLFTEEFNNLITIPGLGTVGVLRCDERGNETVRCTNLLSLNRLLPIMEVGFPYLHFAYLGVSLSSLPYEQQLHIANILNLHIQYYQQTAITAGKKKKFIRFASAIKSLKYLAHVLELLKVSDKDPGKESLAAFLSDTIGDFREIYPGKKKLIKTIN
jgi:hypothetical protein